MRNSEFIRECAENIGDEKARERRHGSLLFRNGVLYSYGEHYPLLFNVNGFLFSNISGYSNTTAHHISYANQYADHKVILRSRRDTYNFISEQSRPDPDFVLGCLLDEKKEILDRIDNLSIRTMRQRGILTERYNEIEEALREVFQK